MRLMILSALFCCLLLIYCLIPKKDIISLDDWTYIQVDSSRTRHPMKTKGGGGWFGLTMLDVTLDRYLDIFSGKWFYRNPGTNMQGKWNRVSVDDSIDVLLSLDVDNDEFSDVIATDLPNVYWLEASDHEGRSWKTIRIGSIPKTKHGNGQGYVLAQVIQGGKPEILLSCGDGIYCFEVPKDPVKGNWPKTHISSAASEEGIGVGDIDGDRDIDIAVGSGEKEEGQNVVWLNNPGNGEGNWEICLIGTTEHFADRIAIADINGDDFTDIVVTEERWPGLEPDANLYWYENSQDAKNIHWIRHTIVTEYSLNNLDVADMDRDGDIDIVVCEHKGPKEKLQIWENDGKGHFTEHLIDEGKESHLGARLADMDNDGDLDIVSIAWDDYQYLHLWRNDAIVRK